MTHDKRQQFHRSNFFHHLLGLPPLVSKRVKRCSICQTNKVHVKRVCIYIYTENARFAKGFEKLYHERSASITQDKTASHASEKRWILDKWAWCFSPVNFNKSSLDIPPKKNGCHGNLRVAGPEWHTHLRNKALLRGHRGIMVINNTALFPGENLARGAGPFISHAAQ